MAIEFDRRESKKKGREVVRRNLWFTDDSPGGRDGPRSLAEACVQFPAGRVVNSREVQSEESSGDKQMSEPNHRSRETNDGGERDCQPKHSSRQFEELGEQDATQSGNRRPREGL